MGEEGVQIVKIVNKQLKNINKCRVLEFYSAVDGVLRYAIMTTYEIRYVKKKFREIEALTQGTLWKSAIKRDHDF